MFNCLLFFRVYNDKSAGIKIPLVCEKSFLSFYIQDFFFLFWQFDYNLSCCGSLEFFLLGIHVISLVFIFMSFITKKKKARFWLLFLHVICLLFSSWYSLTACVGLLDGISVRSNRVLNFLSNFSFWGLDYNTQWNMLLFKADPCWDGSRFISRNLPKYTSTFVPVIWSGWGWGGSWYQDPVRMLSLYLSLYITFSFAHRRKKIFF